MVVVPDNAPETKLSGIRRYGATIIKVPFSEWWTIITTHKCPQAPKNALFVHPGAETSVLAGNATIALEIIDDLPNTKIDCIFVPYGSGALCTGIACGVNAIANARPELRSRWRDCKVVAVEPESAAPFARSIKAGRAMTFNEYRSSFVDGCGGKAVLQEIWALAKDHVYDGAAVSLESVRKAIRIMVEKNRIVAEGAAGCAVAAAMSEKYRDAKNIVCVVSGGGLDTSELISILSEPRRRDATSGGLLRWLVVAGSVAILGACILSQRPFFSGDRGSCDGDSLGTAGVSHCVM